MSAHLSPALHGDTFLRAPRCDVDDVAAGQWIVVGAPSEVTKVSRGGTSLGPQEIRRASLVFDFFVRQQAQSQLVDIESGESYSYNATGLVDGGDIPLGVDVNENTSRISSAVATVVERGATPLLLGGDHYVTYPAVAGLAQATRRNPFAYIHVDMHPDLLDSVPGFGRLSCASPVRRLLEEGVLAPEHTLLYGLDPLLSREEAEYVEESGISVVTNSRIEQEGVAATLAPALERILGGVDGLYASLDIDVLARTFGPGTGNALGTTGLTPGQLSEVVKTLAATSLVGVDLVEVAPAWDPSGRTAGIAASVLAQLMWPVLFRTDAPSPSGRSGESAA